MKIKIRQLNSQNFIIISCLIFAAAAVYFWPVVSNSNFSFAKTAPPPSEPEDGGCYDSDGGRDYYKKGTVKSGNRELSDYCKKEGALIEYYCKTDGSIGIDEYDCSFDCKEGVCKTEPLAPPETPIILSGPGKKVFSTETTAVFKYQSGGATSYKTRLDNGEWSAWSEKTSITYTNLEQGQHTFEVQAKNSFGVSSIVLYLWNINQIQDTGMFVLPDWPEKLESQKPIKVKKPLYSFQIGFPLQDSDGENLDYVLDNAASIISDDANIKISYFRSFVSLVWSDPPIGNWKIVVNINDGFEIYPFEIPVAFLDYTGPFIATPLGSALCSNTKVEVGGILTCVIRALNYSGKDIVVRIRNLPGGNTENTEFIILSDTIWDNGTREKVWQFNWTNIPFSAIGEHSFYFEVLDDPEIIGGIDYRPHRVYVFKHYSNNPVFQLAHEIHDLIVVGADTILKKLELLYQMDLTMEEKLGIADILELTNAHRNVWFDLQILVIDNSRPFSNDELQAIYNAFSAVPESIWMYPILFFGIAGGGGFYGGFGSLVPPGTDYRIILLGDSGVFVVGTNPAFIGRVDFMVHEIGHLMHYRLSGAQEKFEPLYNASNRDDPDDFAYTHIDWPKENWREDFAETNAQWGRDSLALINRARDIALEKNKNTLLKKVILFADFHSLGADKTIFYKISGDLDIKAEHNIPLIRDSLGRIISINGIDVSFLYPEAPLETFDFNDDGVTDVRDMGILMSHWGKSGEEIKEYKNFYSSKPKLLDLSGDEKINEKDISVLISKWGQ